MTMPEHYLPSDIERTSFSIIRQELKEKGKTFPEMEASVVFRCIHATADFDYADLLHFSDGAISDAVHVLQGGCTIVTDTKIATSKTSAQAAVIANMSAKHSPRRSINASKGLTPEKEARNAAS